MNEFERSKLLIGQDNFNKIKNKKILILGLGGVGGYAAISLIRSGIEHITLVDFDKVDITNINRQIIAFHSTIGKNKTKVMNDMILDINPEAKIRLIDKFIDKNNINILFDDNYDYIVDCCDYLETKKLIIKKCLERKIKLISSMGMANKLDPTKIEITTLDQTKNDPIAKLLRKWTNDEKIDSKKIKVVSSIELPIKLKMLGSTSFVPATAGLFIASYIINDIIKKE